MNDTLLHDANGVYVARLLAELNLSPAALARALQVQPSRVYVWVRPESVRPRDEKVWRRLAALAKVVDALRRLVPDDGPTEVGTPREQRQLWLHNPQAIFRFERPIDLLVSDRVEEVFDALWGLYTGNVSL